jgi:hypothetical protein
MGVNYPARSLAEKVVSVHILHLMPSIVVSSPQSPLSKGGSLLLNLIPPLARGVRGVVQDMSTDLSQTIEQLTIPATLRVLPEHDP